MDSDELARLIEASAETRHVEFKRSQSWGDREFRDTIVKSVLAMSNVRDGGTIIVGIDQTDDGTFNPTGVSAEHQESFDIETMRDFVSNFADPFADFSVDFPEYRGKRFAVIVVREFEEHPVICKKDARAVQKGRIYTRTRNRRPESAIVPDHVHLREIVDLAVDKGMRALRERGYVYQKQETAEGLFMDQLRELEE